MKYTSSRSFCEATIADLDFRCGIECGKVSCAIIGLTKWHYDAVGYPIDEAINIERIAPQWYLCKSLLFLFENQNFRANIISYPYCNTLFLSFNPCFMLIVTILSICPVL